MDDPNEPGRELQVRERYQGSWCPWTWDPGFWGVGLVLFGIGLVIAEVFNVDQF